MFEDLGITEMNNADTNENPQLFDGLQFDTGSSITSDPISIIPATNNAKPNSGSFEYLFSKVPDTTPAISNPTANITSSNGNMHFLNDPFASVTSQPAQPQQTSKSKKGDKDPFAEFALGALQI